MNKIFTVISIVLLLTGCVAPRTVTPYYKDLETSYDSVYRIKAPLVIAVQDQRPYVLSGDKNELFYGLSRSLYGIPYSLYGGVTATNDILSYIYLLLNNDNVDSAIQQKPIDIHADGLEKSLKAGNGKKLLFIQVYEWKTDMPAIGTGQILYDLRATVYDKNGNVLAMKNIKGRDNIVNPDPGVKAKPKSGYQSDFESDNESETEGKSVRWYQKARADVLGKILLDPVIVNAINGVETTKVIPKQEVKATKSMVSPPKEEATSKHPDGVRKESQANSSSSTTTKSETFDCSTDQILLMKNAHMTDQQIKAACK